MFGNVLWVGGMFREVIWVSRGMSGNEWRCYLGEWK